MGGGPVAQFRLHRSEISSVTARVKTASEKCVQIDRANTPPRQKYERSPPPGPLAPPGRHERGRRAIGACDHRTVWRESDDLRFVYTRWMDERPIVWDAANRKHLAEDHPEREIALKEIAEVLGDPDRVEAYLAERQAYQVVGRRPPDVGWW